MAGAVLLLGGYAVLLGSAMTLACLGTRRTTDAGRALAVEVAAGIATGVYAVILSFALLRTTGPAPATLLVGGLGLVMVLGSWARGPGRASLRRPS